MAAPTEPPPPQTTDELTNFFHDSYDITPVTLNNEELDKLQDMCRERDLPPFGKKEDLVHRILVYEQFPFGDWNALQRESEALSKKKVVELKEVLLQLDLPVSGTKKVLIQRIMNMCAHDMTIEDDPPPDDDSDADSCDIEYWSPTFEREVPFYYGDVGLSPEDIDEDISWWLDYKKESLHLLVGIQTRESAEFRILLSMDYLFSKKWLTMDECKDPRQKDNVAEAISFIATEKFDDSDATEVKQMCDDISSFSDLSDKWATIMSREYQAEMFEGLQEAVDGFDGDFTELGADWWIEEVGGDCNGLERATRDLASKLDTFDVFVAKWKKEESNDE